MKQLELNHIAPYLPYGLKVYHSGGCIVPMTVEPQKDWKNKGFGINEILKYDYLTPLFYPISALYEEDENGLIPIIELARISFKNSGYGRFICEKDKCKVWNDSSSITFRYSPIYGFTLHYNGRIEPANNQLDLFTYLFENHYDVFGLIDKGLAIDKTKIK